jgi:eukaryotic-like serine/threonine-protein kinase
MRHDLRTLIERSVAYSIRTVLGGGAVRAAAGKTPSEPMHDHVTVLEPHVPSTGGSGVSDLPRDLLEQVRGRVRLLALLICGASAFGPLLFGVRFLVGTLIVREQPPPEFYARAGFVLADVGVAIMSAAIWWIARSGAVSPTRLHTIGLVFQIVLCFEIALTSMWEWSMMKGSFPPLTWVPTVIVLFPLIMPGPPRRMLAAALIAGSTSPLALFVLDRWGKANPVADDYAEAIVSSTFGIAFAYMGARVVYRLGRQVAAARELGSYQLEARLGSGGMGEVWRARHRMLARPAAIKLIRPSSTGVSNEMQQRFEQEAQTIARLRSPHTVELFDFGVADNGSFYYVMELLEGLDADAFVRRFGPVSPERAIFLLRQVCHSLAEAQACGLVHRDIKPANIFLCRYGQDYDFVKVLDFGLVKALGASAEYRVDITRENVMHGTPAFIAPEQALGDTAVDGRADIYATGCVAFWLLTGEMVFSADSTMGIVMHHVRTEPTPPSARTELPIPPALDRLVLACLAKDPSERPQSARELSRRLAEIQSGQAWTEDRARDWWVKHQPAGV